MYIKFAKRIFDMFLSIIIFILTIPIFLIIIFILIFQIGFPIIYWSKRVGKYNKIFFMPKFRTMKNSTPQLATHLIKNPEKYLTKSGKFLRKTSLDELPQLWSIFVGKMSFVGPRPALYNQNDLIDLRTKNKIHLYVPGLTGWAQINGRDELSILEKVKLDEYYIKSISFKFDFIIILKSFCIIYKNKQIAH